MTYDDAACDTPKRALRFILPTFAEAKCQLISKRQQINAAIAGWVAAHASDGDKAAAQSLAQRICIVTIQEFESELQKSVTWLASRMAGQRYHAVVHVKPWTPALLTGSESKQSCIPRAEISAMRPKSSSWVGGKVAGALSRSCHLRGCIVMNNAWMPQLVEDASHGSLSWSGRNLVLADDAMYSGQQMKRLIYSVAEAVTNNAQTAGRMSNWQRVKIWVIVPYRTQSAHRMLLDVASEYRDDAVLEILVCPQFVPMESARQVMAELNICDSATDTDWCPCMDDEPGPALTVFEHKIPDGASFPMLLSKGHLIRDGILDGGTAVVPFLPRDDPKPYAPDRVMSVARHVRGGWLDDTVL